SFESRFALFLLFIARWPKGDIRELARLQGIGTAVCWYSRIGKPAQAHPASKAGRSVKLPKR
ncbi:MAG: hypothetical protein ACYC6N_22695, partial [Pirellulaceae bacterium]